MCRNILQRVEKINQKFRDLTMMSFKPRAEVIEQMHKAVALRTYEIAKRVKEGTHDGFQVENVMPNSN